MYVVSTNIGTLNALCPYPTITFLIQHCFAKRLKSKQPYWYWNMLDENLMQVNLPSCLVSKYTQQSSTV